MKNILVIAAHPDDEVLGCGGTIAKLADTGHKVNVAFVMVKHQEKKLIKEMLKR